MRWGEGREGGGERGFIQKEKQYELTRPSQNWFSGEIPTLNVHLWVIVALFTHRPLCHRSISHTSPLTSCYFLCVVAYFLFCLGFTCVGRSVPELSFHNFFGTSFAQLSAEKRVCAAKNGEDSLISKAVVLFSEIVRPYARSLFKCKQLSRSRHFVCSFVNELFAWTSITT